MKRHVLIAAVVACASAPNSDRALSARADAVLLTLKDIAWFSRRCRTTWHRFRAPLTP